MSVVDNNAGKKLVVTHFSFTLITLSQGINIPPTPATVKELLFHEEPRKHIGVPVT